MAKGLIRHLAHIQPVQRCQIHQLGGRLQQEVAEEARAQILLRCLAEQLAEGRKVALVADDAEDVVRLQTGTARGVQQLLLAEQGADAGAGRHLQIPQRRADAPLLVAQAIDEGLPLAIEIDLEPGAVDGRGGRRHFDPGEAGGQRQRAALQDQRDQHHEEGDIEVELGVGQPRHHGEHRQNDRHGAAQPDPGDEPALARGEVLEWQQAYPDRDGAGEQDHPHGQRQRRQGDGQQLVGGGEQPQHQEHADLAEPGEAVQHRQGGAATAQGEVAEQQAGEVDGQDAATAYRRGEGEDEQAAAHGQQRVEAGGQPGAVDELPQQPAGAKADAGSQPELLEQLQQQKAAIQPLLGGGQHLDQGDGKKHRHGIVAA